MASGEASKALSSTTRWAVCGDLPIESAPIYVKFHNVDKRQTRRCQKSSVFCIKTSQFPDGPFDCLFRLPQLFPKDLLTLGARLREQQSLLLFVQSTGH